VLIPSIKCNGQIIAQLLPLIKCVPMFEIQYKTMFLYKDYWMSTLEIFSGCAGDTTVLLCAFTASVSVSRSTSGTAAKYPECSTANGSQWARPNARTRKLRSCVRIPFGAWMFVSLFTVYYVKVGQIYQRSSL
jgi:hypothetical protein